MRQLRLKYLTAIIAGFLFLIYFKNACAQKPAPTFKLFLIGDAGEGDTTGATLFSLKLKLQSSPNSAVVFLGDNCYTRPVLGLAKLQVGGFDGGKVGRRRIMSQINILRGYKGSAYFIPGNHDWYNLINLEHGKKHLLKEEKYIEDSLKHFTDLKNDSEEVFLPQYGEPGPISKKFNDSKTRVIFIDTYRLIIEEARSKKKRNTALLDKFYSDLNDQLNDATKKSQKIIVVSHHPIHSKGKHSFPLTFWENLLRKIKDSNTNYPPYKRMAIHLDSLLKAHRHPDIYYVSEHEHSLEYFYNDSLHYIVSGAGSRIDKVQLESCQDAVECLQWNEEGFFEIDFYGRKETVLMYHRKDNKSELKVLCIAGCN